MSSNKKIPLTKRLKSEGISTYKFEGEQRIKLTYDYLPDIERIPRGMYLVEAFGGNVDKDNIARAQELTFAINRKANLTDVLEALLLELEANG